VKYELCDVATNRGALPLLFLARESHADSGAQRGHPPRRVNEIGHLRRCERVRSQRRDRESREDGKRAVVGVSVARRRHQEKRRAPTGDLRVYARYGFRGLGDQEPRQAAVRETEERCTALRNVEAAERRQCLAASPFTPPLPVGRRNTPSPFHDPLRPGIVLAVRDENDARRSTGSQGALEKASGRERLVVWMWSQDHHTVARRQVER
jgi:hypothetical protein